MPTHISTRTLWSILETYYEWRDDPPTTSILSRFAAGGPDLIIGGISNQLAFVCDVGTVLSHLRHDELEAVELYYHTHRAWEDAEACRRNADLVGRRRGEVRDVRQLPRAAKAWREIADVHQSELHRIRQRKAYRTAVVRLTEDVARMLVDGRWREVEDE
jgi:hypothetical protein